MYIWNGQRYLYICTKMGKLCWNFYTKCAVNLGKLRVLAKIAWIYKFFKIALHNFAIFWWDYLLLLIVTVVVLVLSDLWFVTGLLQNHAASCRSKPGQNPYLALPHVRDALIPLADRQADGLLLLCLLCIICCLLYTSPSPRD